MLQQSRSTREQGEISSLTAVPIEDARETAGIARTSHLNGA
eukprot:SAG25_NODE_12647_length_277_cov_0.578652_2_plen_40_part_01